MKIITNLDKNNYIQLPSDNKWYKFQDKDTAKVKIYSELKDPFKENIVLLFSFQNKKTIILFTLMP